MAATGVNFADLLMRAGLYGTVPPLPYSPGFEAVGVIRRLGPGVTDWAMDHRAVALIRHGGYARDLIVSTTNLFRCPAGLSAAGGVGTAGSEPKRRFVVDQLGAAACFDSNGDWGAEVERLVGTRGVDVALDAGPAKELVRDDPGLVQDRVDRIYQAIVAGELAPVSPRPAGDRKGGAGKRLGRIPKPRG